jgi:hypothetical protein
MIVTYDRQNIFIIQATAAAWHQEKMAFGKKSTLVEETCPYVNAKSCHLIKV